MYGIIKEYSRIPDNEFKYWTKNKKTYVFVDEGFFEVRNIFRPIPLGFLTIIAHILYGIGIYLVIANRLWTSLIVSKLYEIWGGMSVTGGSHRLWCHRAYSARLPLKIFFMLGQTISFQYSIYSWSIGHRVHHKYSDTDADPHSTSRGFFFAHAGWMFRKEHPDVSMRERLYNFSDLDRDAVIVFQHKYFYPLLVLMAFIIPMSIHMFILGDTFLQALCIGVAMRILSSGHATAFVNSAAHMFGGRPYNLHIPPVENYYVTLASFGEGYHNYHHSFPWDYKAAELGSGFNSTTLLINFMALIGQAYNLKVASDDVIKGGRYRNGDLMMVEKKNKSIVMFGQQIIDNQSKGVGVEVAEDDPGHKEGEKEPILPPPAGNSSNNNNLIKESRSY